jgi:hypothetical protein
MDGTNPLAFFLAGWLNRQCGIVVDLACSLADFLSDSFVEAKLHFSYIDDS